MIRVIVLYPEEPDPGRYPEHVELARREAPEATIRHGRVLGAAAGEPRYRYYFEYEFADRDAWKRAQQGLMAAAEDAREMGLAPEAYFVELDA